MGSGAAYAFRATHRNRLLAINHSDVTLPLEGRFSSGRELMKGVAFFIALVGTITVINGVIMLAIGHPHGRAVLLFSAAMWLAWLGLRAVKKIRERARIAMPTDHIHLTGSEITVPQLTGRIETVRWMDVKEVRLTRDTEAAVYYEFYGDNEMPSLVLARSRVLDPETLDRELEKRTGKVVQAFHSERVAPAPPAPASESDTPSGERFSLSLPSTRGATLRGCGGVVLGLAVLAGLAFALSDIAINWMKSGVGTIVVIAVLLAGVFLAMRSPKAWIVGAADGLHVRAPGVSFPPFIPWSDLLDYTFVKTRGRNPQRNLMVWTSAGSWKLDGVRITGEEKLLSMLRERSARKQKAFVERVG